MKKPSAFLKISQASKTLGVSQDTLRRWEKQGKIKPIKTAGGTRLYPEFVKIGTAAKKLSVSIDTLRRWERSGKITALRTPGGTRLYSLDTLEGLIPQKVHIPAVEAPETIPQSFEKKVKTTENLLKELENQQFSRILTENPPIKLPKIRHENEQFGPKSKIYAQIYAQIYAHPKIFLPVFATIIITGAAASAFLSSRFPSQTPISHFPPSTSNVLAVATGPQFLEINSDSQINGSLFVSDQINNLFLEGTPSASTITLSSGDTTLTVSDSAEIDQDISTTSAPTFSSLTLSSTTNQLSSGGFQFTLPGATTTLVGTNTTQTLTNKSLSGSANTFTNIPNSALSNSKVTVTAGTNLTGGGDVSLGSSVTLSLKSSPSVSGVLSLADGTASAPALTFTDDTDTGLYRLGSNKIGLITGGSATSGITIDSSGNLGIGIISPSSKLSVSGNLAIGTTYAPLAAPLNGLIVQGNVGIGASDPVAKLSVAGNLAVGVSFGYNLQAPTHGLAVEGNVGIGITTANSALTVSGGAVIGTGYNLTAPTNGLLVQGLVGIGTTAPGGTFGVAGNQLLGATFANLTGPANGLAVQGNVGVGVTTANSNLAVAGNLALGTGYAGMIAPTNGLLVEGSVGIGISVPSQTFQIGTAGNALVFTSGGNLGVGITTPSQSLEVIGTARIRGAVGNTGLVVTSNGNVGIGTTAPGAGLQLTTNGLIGYTGNVYGPSSGLAISGNVGIGITTANSLLSVAGGAHIGSLRQGIAAPTDGLFVDGNVGIGATSTAYNLDVWGNGRFSSALTVGGNLGIGTSLTVSSGSHLQSSLRVDGNTQLSSLTTSGNVRIGGSLTVEGITVTNGDVDLGSSAANTVTFIGVVDSNILPDASNTRNIGSSALRWANGYFTTVDATNLSGTVTGGSTTSASWTINSDNSSNNAEVGSLAFETGSGSGANFNAVLQWNASGDAGRISGFDNYNLFNFPVAIFSQVSGANQTFTSGSLFKYSQPSAHAITQSGAFIGSELDFSSNITVPNSSSGNQTGVKVTLSDGGAAATSIGYQTAGSSDYGLYLQGETQSYFSGNVGIGVSLPVAKLSVQGNVGIGYSNSVIPTNGLAVSGNVGIGITTANSTLSVAGGAHIGSLRQGIAAPTDGLFVDGNVGIGATSTAYNLDVWGTGRFSSGLTVAGNLDIGTSLTVSSLTLASGGLRVNGFSDLTGNVGVGGSLTANSLSTFLSSILGADGSATAPAYAFNLDTDTGIFRPGTNALGLTTGGASRLTVTAAGLVGIGITSPAAAFQVNSGSSATVITSTGNVGIGITTANSTLSVAGGAHIGSLRQGIAAPTDGLFVDGNVGIGATTSNNILDVWGNVGIGNSLTVSSATVLNTLNVSSISSLSGNVGIGNSLTVGSGVNFLSSLRVVGNTQLSTLTTSGDITNSGVFLASDGTASAPGYSFTQDTDTGIFRPSSDALGLTTGGTSRLTLTAGGNVGIGFSSPATTLGVSGNVNIGFTGSVSDPLGLAVRGNVGVGTTSPLQALHVVGQCVAKGTRIRRKRKGLRGKGDGWEEVPVEDIKADDEILSLNDQTGEFEWHKVEKTMDMGIQEVFRLETATGKWIETTANHPYLIQQNNLTAGRLFVESNIDKQPYNKQQSIGNKKLNIEISPINHFFNPFFLRINATTNETIPAMMLAVNNPSFGTSSFSKANGLAIAANIQPADILINNSDIIPNHKGSILVTQDTLATVLLDVNQPTNWVKVSQLKVGMIIATATGWEQIRTIYSTGRKQTYDLQIENTHNFVGNDIVAHNTYINSGLNIGAAFTGGAAVPSNGLAVSGNVGIGITTANSTLSVAGGAHIGSLRQGIAAPTDGLFVDGNVGIGATSTAYNLDVWGNGRFSSGLTVGGNLDIGTSLNVSNLTFAQGGLRVNGFSDLTGNVGVGGSLTANSLSTFLSSILGADGSATAPSYSFNLDTDTGMFRPSVNALGLSTNGLSRLTVTAAGLVGIGITSPAATFQVNSGASATVITSTGNVGIGITTANSTLSVAGGAHIGSLRQGIAAPTDGLFVDGNVGIGATSTAYNLDVWGNGRFSSGLTVAGNLDIGTSLTVSSAAALTTLNVSGISSLVGNVGIGGSLTANSLSTFLSSILGADGSATAPSYSFNLDTDTGMFRPSVNAWGLSTNGSSRLTVTESGNLGIGLTHPSTTLAISGNVNIGYTGYTSEPLGLAVRGNVGVGTTSPLQALHVVGQCVAKGTRIRRKRKGLRGKGDGWEEVPVEDIKADDEILSLNDQTGEFEWHKVEKTMDMGIQEVFRLETETGKWIETTANHPYLVKRVLMGGLFEEQNAQEYGNQNQSKSNLNISAYVYEFLATHFSISSSLALSANISIPSRISPVKISNPSTDVSWAKLGVINAAPNQPADRLILSPDDAFNQDLAVIFTPSTLSDDKLSVNQSEAWIKVSRLKVGMEIATSDGWEKIISIQNVGRKQTYDLQIANTHNFLANNIVAHNTYITGNVGIGATSTAYNLDVWGNGRFSSGLTVAGNLDIGTSLTVSSAAALTTLNVSGISSLVGNVGIGGSLTANSLSTFLSSILGADGSATAPAYSFNLDTDTGMFRPSVNALGLSTNGLSRLTVTESGNLGIGLTHPSTTLAISGNVNIGYTGYTSEPLGLAVRGNMGIGTTSPRFPLEVWGNGTYSTLLLNGNVGVGTTSPNARLQVIGGNVGIGATSSSNLLDVWGNVGIGSSLTVSSAAVLNTLNVSGISSLSGNVGIGGSLNVSSLSTFSSHILPSADDSYDLGSNTQRWRDLYLGPGTLHIGTSISDEYTISYDTTANSLGFNVNGSGVNEIVFDSSGNVGIGFTTPDRLLLAAADIDIVGSNASLLGAAGTQFAITGSLGTGGTEKKLVLGIDTTDNFGVFQAGNTSGTNYALSLNPAGGNVGVGTTSPLQNLHVQGQCVAAGTRIRRRRRLSNGRISEDEWEEVPVEDIMPGDEVLSLNEYTEEFEYHKVEKLLDRGTRGVYELTTKSGKTIKTTSEHPYLVQLMKHHQNVLYPSPIQDAGWVKVTHLKVGDQIAIADIPVSRKVEIDNSENT